MVNVMNWEAVPYLVMSAVILYAFASVARHSHTFAAKLWVVSWLLVLVHLTANVFAGIPGIWGSLVYVISPISLFFAGVLYASASLPFRNETSSRWMLGAISGVGALYITLLSLAPEAHLALNLVVVLAALCPLAVTLAALRTVNTLQRWFTVLLCGTLSIFLLIVQDQHPYGPLVARNAILFAVFAGNLAFATMIYRRATAGTFITIFGFFCWALSYVIAPMTTIYWPQLHIDSKWWDLPLFGTGVGMLLLLLEEQIARNKYLALHDPLTGLPNRRLFEDRIASAVERSRRAETQMAVITIDLNGFKQINDTMGHHMGDLVLQHIASAFIARVRRSETLARTGGDEFSIILESTLNRDDAETLAGSLRQLLNEPLEIEGQKVRLGASFGIAVFPDDGLNAESLCIVADRRMYAAKRRSQESKQYDVSQE